MVLLNGVLMTIVQLVMMGIFLIVIQEPAPINARLDNMEMQYIHLEEPLFKLTALHAVLIVMNAPLILCANLVIKAIILVQKTDRDKLGHAS
ncbi:UNKNOWN [Stylonychia lemnae]|uniref:Uncharacterized protein n=1 Tax=Stylonychia lemnae TaxID=5949 RepID=A0A078AXY6_STYLE|nr:UNKNOWN [Stylonychia lemnae]|eukprot:CDW86946.1 UNKNOWN [Stylonychia lemnae]